MSWATADDWWKGACDELEAARALKAVGKVPQAYFHAGQAIEFGLKALFMKRNGLARMPDDRKGAHHHNLQACARDARLERDLRGASKLVKANWLTVRDWRSNARFPDAKAAQKEMVDFFVAVCNDREGVWPWLQTIYLNA